MDLPRKLSRQGKIDDLQEDNKGSTDEAKENNANDHVSSTALKQHERPVVDAIPNINSVLKNGVHHEKNIEKNHFTQSMSIMEYENLLEKEHISQIRLCSAIIYTNVKYTKESFGRLFLSKELLEHLFKLFDQNRDQKLIQEEWIEFLKARLTKEIDFVEQIESVAYCICRDAPIGLEQFYTIFNAKGIVDKIYKIIDKDNVGWISSEQIMDFLASVTNSRPRTGFDKGSLEQLEKVFKDTVGDEKEIRREDFKKIVTSKNPFFTERVFQIFDRDNSGSISLQEFLDAVHQFAGKSPEDKIKFLFKVYDLDGDGLIQHKELHHVMKACMEENGMQFSEEQIDDLTCAMFEDADPHGRGAITYENLKNQLEKHDGLLENLSISIDRWLVPPKPKPPATLSERCRNCVPYQLTKPYFKNNYVYIIFLGCYIFINVSLFISRVVEYSLMNAHICIIIARACGQCLNFNCMFVLVLMLRHCITFLRTRGFGEILPLDNHIYFHKLTGTLIFVYSVIHTVMHFWFLPTGVEITNELLIKSNCNHTEYDTIDNCVRNYTMGSFFISKFGLVDGCAYVTGVILMLILCVMFICSQPFVRKRGSFEVFYWTHILYIPFWILLILHCPNFWKWFIIPGILYLIERAYRFQIMKSERGKTYISSGIVLASQVIHLVIKRPLHFDYHPGDFVFVNIPTIAKYEWHPFTISSAPEQEDYIWLHIRVLGQWTSKLYQYFQKEQDKLHNGEMIITEEKKPCLSRVEKEHQSPIKKIQATISRTFSNKEPNRPVQLVGFSHDGFQLDPKKKNSISESDLHSKASCSKADLNYSSSKISPDQKFSRIFGNKVLEKSLSMPDMQTKAKKKERLLFLKEYMRSESEKSFDECQMKKARLRTLGLAYTTLQNKSLAQSFRYMRNKPTIIAFKTPSLEHCEERDSSSSLIISKCPEKTMEEGKSHGNEQGCLKPIDYPIGKPLEILLDGPYGAPSSHIFRAQHAVLIATGIGVTPSASILRSIMIRYLKARHKCPKCEYCWSSEIPQSVMNLKKVDFFWINRTQKAFEWFVNLLSELEIGQAELGEAMERFLEMHMYITSALQKNDMKAVGLQLALDLLHEKEKRDLITGLKTRTNAGRPNWDKIFNQLSTQKKGKVTVFYCGKPNLARILRMKCDEYGFNFRKEVF
nr:NADPH oxidase 5 isoform X2 [Onthophagus taurus]